MREHVSVGSGKQLIKRSKTNAIVAAEKKETGLGRVA